MAKIIYWDIDNFRRIRSDDGGADGTSVRIGYQEGPEWEIHFTRLVSGVVTAADVSDATTWEAAFDKDFSTATEPMGRTLNANIDSSDAANGIITVTLDADTSTYLAAISTSEKIKAWFRLKGLNVATKPIHRCQFEIIAENDIDPAGGVAPDPAGNYYTKTEIDAGFNAKIINTDLTLTDDDTTYLSLGAATSYYGWLIEYMIISGTNRQIGKLMIYHDGTNAHDDFPNYRGYDFSGTVTISSEYNSGTPRLKFVVASHGSNPVLTYRITGYFEV